MGDNRTGANRTMSDLTVRALVELMHADPDAAEPVVLAMLAEPLADQLLAELVAKEPTATDAIIKMSTHSDALRRAFARVIDGEN